MLSLPDFVKIYDSDDIQIGDKMSKIVDQFRLQHPSPTSL